MNKKDVLNIKGLTVILMILHHLFAYKNINEYVSIIPFFTIEGYTIEKIVGLFGKICVTTYLFLSGYGMGKKYPQTIKIKDSIKQCWKLYKIYIIVFLVFIPWRFLFKGNVFELKEFLLNLIGYYSTYNKEWWFFGIYVLLIVFMPIISRIKKNKIPYISFLIMCIGYVARIILNSLNEYYSIKLFLKSNEWFWIYNLLLCQFAFCLGYYLSSSKNIFDKLKNYCTKLSSFKLIILGTMVVIIKWKVRGGYMLDTFLVPFYIMIFMTLIKRKSWLEKVFVFCGKNSTWIWLTHSFFCYYYLGNYIYSLKYSILIFIGTLILSILSAFLLNYIYMKINNLSNIIKGVNNESIIYN